MANRDEVYQKLNNPLPDNKRDTLVFPKGSGESSGDCISFEPNQIGSEPLAPDLKKVQLFMPISINSSYTANWEGEDFRLNGDVGEIFQKGKEIFSDVFDSGLSMIGFGDNTSGNLSQRNRRDQGRAKNLNTTLLFKTMDLRSFDFEWTLAAKSKREVSLIQDILKSFKIGMHPSRIGTGPVRYIRRPNTWTVNFISEGSISKQKYFRINDAAITSCSLEYGNQTSYVTLPDGDPTQIKLKVSIKELELITKKEIREGN